ncbi:hypothetical protein MAR_021608 [Mya arenaria]|uniref:Uncharacterized protein n=1 Tax=Mya arenaria TaxID=6604 RepID=A0ABY7EAP6_MYAAR|nr:hypothetical protein MAR_021608 [Mya arenaria]
MYVCAQNTRINLKLQMLRKSGMAFPQNSEKIIGKEITIGQSTVADDGKLQQVELQPVKGTLQLHAVKINSDGQLCTRATSF